MTNARHELSEMASRFRIAMIGEPRHERRTGVPFETRASRGSTRGIIGSRRLYRRFSGWPGHCRITALAPNLG